MTNEKKSFLNWQKRVKFFNEEYPFGQIRELRDVLGRLHAPETGDGFAVVTNTRCTGYKEGRLHGIDVDVYGSCTFYYEGIMVPPSYIQHPENLKFEDMVNHPNTEVRYVGMKIYGYERLRKEDKCTILDEDPRTGSELLKFDGVLDEPIVLIKVINASPEPDGTYKEYYLHVPPDMKTCKNAVAWTFRKTESEYQPAQET